MANNITVKDGSGVTQTLRTIDSGTYQVPQQGRAAQAGQASNVHAPAANTAAVVTKGAGGAGVSNVLASIAYSYSIAPTGGNLKVEDGSGVTVFTQDIVAAGPGVVQFNPPLRGSSATALIVTLAAGGSGVSGKVNAHTWTE